MGNRLRPRAPRIQKAYDRARGSAAGSGYDSQWQKIQAIYKMDNPLCENCKDHGISKRADVIHHIVEIAEGGDRLAFSNLKSLCMTCHNEVHRETRKK